MEKHAFSILEVMQQTSLGRSKIYEEISNGRLRAVKLGNRTLVLAEDLDKFLQALPAVVQSHLRTSTSEGSA